MDEKCFNYYEKGTKIGNYSIFHNSLVVDKDNRVLMSDESGRNEILKGGIFAMKYVEKHEEGNITKYKLWDSAGRNIANSWSGYDLYAYCQTGDGKIALTFQEDFNLNPPYCRIISNKGEIIKDKLTHDEMREYILK